MIRMKGNTINRILHITEDTWLPYYQDTSVNLRKILALGRKYRAEVCQILLSSSLKRARYLNNSRSMKVPLQELQDIYEKVYSLRYPGERIIVKDVNN